ncbi:MAG: hypothetical protein E7328_01835 [Clostridiales bacterium]|nr:hypothetical protein [Clostridiales bacterium]
MRNRNWLFSVVLIVLMLALAACGGKVSLNTDIGTMEFARAKGVSSFDTLTAKQGEQLLVLGFKSADLDEAMFNRYFVPAEDAEGAKARVNGTAYDCAAVGYQGNSGKDTVEYALIFAIPSNVDVGGATIEFKAPNYDWVNLK